MQCAIFRGGRAVGTLSVEDDGLYRVLRGRIGASDAILHLYLRGESFGVFCPEDGALGLCRRVSRTRLPEDPAFAVAWCPEDGRWRPEGDHLRRDTPRGRELAVAWGTRSPMAFPAAPGKLRARRLEGSYYLVCALSPPNQ